MYMYMYMYVYIYTSIGTVRAHVHVLASTSQCHDSSTFYLQTSLDHYQKLLDTHSQTEKNKNKKHLHVQ